MKSFWKSVVLYLTIVLIGFGLACACDAAVAEGDTMYVAIDSGYLNGRAEPNKHSEVLVKLQNGDAVTVLDIQDGWAKLDEGGEMECSYARVEYLSSFADGEGKRMTVRSDGRVRLRKTIDGDVCGYLKNGEHVTVTLLYDGWAKTKKGWVKTEYLEAAE